MLSTEVTRIGVADGRAESVTTAAGERFEADLVLFDGDARASMDLIGAEHFGRRFRRKLDYEYGPSVVSMYLGLKDIDLRAYGLGEENIYWHPKVDLNEVYDDQLGDTIPERPFLFCNAPTLRRHRGPLAPEGGAQLVVVAPCRFEVFERLRARSEEAYQAAKRTWAERLRGVIEEEFVPDLGEHVEVEVVGTPLTNRFYVRAPKGNCYSTPLDPRHVNLRRVNYRSPFPNLHYVGASASLPGFATLVHFACLLYGELTGDRVY